MTRDEVPSGMNRCCVTGMDYLVSGRAKDLEYRIKSFLHCGTLLGPFIHMLLNGLAVQHAQYRTGLQPVQDKVRLR
jgi:hypothetical protein